ncbi:alkaline phosphatase family protein [Herbaspirillum sp. SJZ107]|uniref:alkaline phosphatase family protein n=1 Tax=Herbaspirillum sp. SJZ107 TaxID=2572881 RepID=UPI00114F724E|nr:alkaline phosphatase family protein [Herbaspirillum sp. SJZ107]TQK11021.1 type I phosphodiesterase/nucleotide pyrophosphatase [Herbaspirillum sp. SJZ107]
MSRPSWLHPTLSLFTCAALLAPAVQSAHAAPKTAPAPIEAAAPKLVVVMVIDGLPAEQLQRYRGQFGQGGLRRLMEQGASFTNAHQAHGVTVTAIGHTAVLTGAYPYRHGIIGNNWIDGNGKLVYCTEDARHHYIGEETEEHDGTSPAKLRVDTLGDQLRYASGNRSKVVTVSGKDRGAILLAGKTGTAYMYMDKTGDFASSTYYMQQHPAWVERFKAAKPQDRYYAKSWKPLLPDAAYADDAPDPAPSLKSPNRFPFTFYSESGQPAADYYGRLKTSPAVDELTLEFARAAVEGENLGSNASGATDLLGISLSGHDYVNHAYGPESRMSHDHLQQIDRRIADFFNYLDKRIGMDNVLVVLTADHGFANTAEFSQGRHMDATRIDPKPLRARLEAALAERFRVAGLVKNAYLPEIYLDYAAIERNKLARRDVEDAAARFLLTQPGIADVFTRSQLEQGVAARSRVGTLMQRAWNRELSGDLMVVTAPYTSFGSGDSGATHGTPYNYDSNVPLLMMGGRWIRPGVQAQYTEVVDIAPTLAQILHLRPPAAAEGRVLTEALR